MNVIKINGMDFFKNKFQTQEANKMDLYVWRRVVFNYYHWNWNDVKPSLVLRISVCLVIIKLGAIRTEIYIIHHFENIK